MKHFYALISLFCWFALAIGQTNIDIPYTALNPTIDGVEEALWDAATAVSIDSAFQAEEPTVSGYWKAMWGDDFLYVLVSVEDDDHYPAWEAGGDWYNFDQPEVYLDINETLEDGQGPGNKGTGHYQVQPGFTDGGSGTPGSLSSSNYRPGGTYCYVLVGSDYVFEYALDYTSFVNDAMQTMSKTAFEGLDKIGFDVTIIDQDEGVTDARQRAVWHNTGAVNESYGNMDDCGTITLVESLPSALRNQSLEEFQVYPNPVTNVAYINAVYDKVVITNILGKEVETIFTSEQKLNLETLSQGVYLIQIYQDENSVGITKILKQ